jgi:hypothetical protein
VSDLDPLDEYKLNVDLWKHDDTLRESHNQTFIGATSAALVAAGLVISASDNLVVQGGAAMVAALLGSSLAWVWNRTQQRHNAYIAFHREMLVALEPAAYSTFRLQTAAFQKPWETVRLPNGRRFSLAEKARRSASDAEALVPRFVGIFWIAAFVAGLAAVLVGAC